jgi:hypothetical protein
VEGIATVALSMVQTSGHINDDPTRMSTSKDASAAQCTQVAAGLSCSAGAAPQSLGIPLPSLLHYQVIH